MTISFAVSRIYRPSICCFYGEYKLIERNNAVGVSLILEYRTVLIQQYNRNAVEHQIVAWFVQLSIWRPDNLDAVGFLVTRVNEPPVTKPRFYHSRAVDVESIV